MYATLVLGLLSSHHVFAHPTAHHGPSSIRRRMVDLESFRLKATAQYVNATEALGATSTLLVKRDGYVDTAVAFVKDLVPFAEFRIVEDHYVGTNGIAHVNLKQTAYGLDIDNADFNINASALVIAADGTIFSYGDNFFKGELPATNPLKKRGFKDPVTALTGATSMLELPVNVYGVSAVAKDRIETYSLTGTTGAVSDPEARLVYFVKEDGNLALTWRVETDIMDNWLLTYVDAETNEEVHGVVDYVAHATAATYLVYPWGINDPSEGSRQTVVSPWTLADSPFTWINDGSTTYDTTRGNNGIAQVNPSGSTASNAYLTNYRPESSTYNFSYTYSTTMTPPSSYRDASVTQIFYTANMYHDLLYELGFNEAAGNFEVNNNGKGGKANDFVILNAQDGAGTNNADFSTPPDGQMGRMRMYIWTYSTPNRDCAFEAGVIIHEYTHGVSNRLTGGPANSNCLNSLESGGMGEGWGDFMATLIRLKSADTRSKDYPMGAWVYNNAKGIRAYPYSTSLTTNPYAYTSVNGMTEVHSIGTVWATMLYEVMWNLIDKYGKTTASKPTFSNGVPTDGRYLAMKLVIDGMALQPCNPNFVQARDAILDADTALTGGKNQCEIWTAFAKRGLGSGAVYSSSRRTGSTTVPSGVC